MLDAVEEWALLESARRFSVVFDPTAQQLATGRDTVKIGFRNAFGAVAAWLLLFCLVDRAGAVDASVPLSLLERTAFHAREGAPGGIQAVVQTSDGVLWLGTQGGLYQFDGVVFRRYLPPEPDRLPDWNVSALAAASDGGLWAATRFGHVYLIGRNSLRVFGAAEGLPEHTIFGLVVASSGRVWVGSRFGVFRLIGNRWAKLLNIDGTPSSADDYDCLKLDRHGNLWMTDRMHLSVLRPDAEHVTVLRTLKVPQGILLDGRGEAWLSDSRGIYRLTDERVGIPESKLPGTSHGSPNQAFVYFIDSAGMAWGLTSRGDGFRIPLPELAPRSEAAGLGKPHEMYRERILGIDIAIRPFWVQDLEGNVWITSSSGLDRFRSTKFRRVVIDGNAIGAGALVESNTGVLLTESDAGLYKRVGEEFTRVSIGKAMRCPACPIFMSKDGNLYRSLRQDLQRLGRSGFEPMSQPVDRTQGGLYHAISEDDDGRLWVSVTAGKGIFTWSGEKWEQFRTGPGTQEASLSVTSTGGRVWLGFLHGQVAIVRGSKVRHLDKTDGLSIGDVLVVAAQGEAAWLAGTGGLAYFDGSKVRTVVAKRQPWIGVSGLVLTPEGDLWLNSQEGVRRISKAELTSFLNDPKHRVEDELFDFHSGLEGTPAQFEPLPTAARTPDGLLWFATSTGLFTIDPLHIASNHVAPQVAVAGVRSNGASYFGASISLPARSSAIEINYSAAILAVPDLARFKYRLVGVDANWQDVGGRRSAFYTNLVPGSYRFQVMAANEDGVWSEHAAEMTVEIAPAYWQTGLFRVGMVALVTLLVALSGLLWHRIRVRRISRALRLEAGIQQAERERIARDLHDTLLQNMHALIWRMDVVSRTFVAGDQRQTEMSEALDRAEKALGAGRKRIFSPQESWSEDDQPLVERLSELGQAWSADTGIGFSLDVQDERKLRPGVVSLLDRILAEAIVNAFRHGRASQVMLKLRFEKDSLTCIVSDDGVGVPAEFLEKPPEGHLGLRLMRDRAATLGAHLLIQRGASGGSEIVLTLTSSKAYARAHFIRRLASGLWRLRQRRGHSDLLPGDASEVHE